MHRLNRGVLLKLISCLFFSCVNACVHALGQQKNGISSASLLFYQNAIALLVLLPYVGYTPFSSGFSSYWKPLVLRSCFAVAGMVLWFESLKYLPLLYSISFKLMVPILTVVGACFILGESFTQRKKIAFVLALGAGIILMHQEIYKGFTQPFTLQGPLLLPLAASIFIAISSLIGKRLTDALSPELVTIALLLFSLPLLGVCLITQWAWPTPDQWPFLILMGLCSAGAYLTLHQAFFYADLSALVPVSMARFIFNALLSILIFQEWATPMVWIGGILLIISIAVLTIDPTKKQKGY